jgi:hypothetical protein
MLNLNLNILGASNKPIVPIQPAPDPTTTTTTTSTTTTTTTTTSTTTTSGPASVRTDIYSASLVYAAPGSEFTTLGMTSFRQDISEVIRGNGTGFGILPTTGSGTVSAATASYFTGYNSSMQLSGSINNGAINGFNSKIDFRTSDFTVETWMNFSISALADVGAPDINPAIYFQYPDGVGFAGTTTDAFDPGIRFLVIKSDGGEIYIDSPSVGRNANTWYHYAVQRSGSLMSAMFNGNCIQSFTVTGNLKQGAQALQLGNRSDVTVNPVRYQDYRIYKGIPKYGSITSGSSYTLPLSMVIA